MESTAELWDTSRPREDELSKPIDVLSEICSVPGTDEPVSFDRKGRASSAGGRRFRAKRGVPILRDEDPAVIVKSRFHVSGGIAQDRIDAMCALDGYTLLLGGGNTAFAHPRVIDVEFHLYRGTDVVADAHRLPFRSNTFELFFAMNVFEHLRAPAVAAAEALRVLKPGGRVHIHTAFLQPLHEEPAHYYNATEFGAREWLREFESVECSVSGNFNPLYAGAWWSEELLRMVTLHLGRDAADAVGDLTLAELARFWSHPEGWNPSLREVFFKLPEPAQRRIAAGFDLQARKPGGDAPRS